MTEGANGTSGSESKPEPTPYYTFFRGGIDIHVESRVVDNATAAIRWCQKEPVAKHIASQISKNTLDGGTGFRILLVAQRKDDHYGKFEIRNVLDHKQGFSFITFPRPGKWNIAILLFDLQSSEKDEDVGKSLERALIQRFLSRTGLGDSYEQSMSALFDAVEKPATLQNNWIWGNAGFSIHPISVGHVEVEVPQALFSHNDGSAYWEFATYWQFLGTPKDDCEARRRFVFMCTLGLIPYVFIEGSKRLLLLVAGLTLYLFGIRGSEGVTYGVIAPKVRIHIKEFNTTHLNEHDRPVKYDFYKGWGNFLTPGMMLVYASFALLAAKYPETMTNIGIVILILIGSIIFFSTKTGEKVGSAIEAWLNRRAKRITEEKAEARRKAELEALDRLHSALVCGTGQQRVSLGSLPREMRSFRLYFDSFKRAVCRPIA